MTTITLNNDERQPCEVWTRVMGYHRPTTSFNHGKKSEHRERKFFAENKCRLDSRLRGNDGENAETAKSAI